MILLRDIRDYIASLCIAEDEHCFCGKLPDKKDKSIGIYNLRTGRQPTTSAGGDKNRSYKTKAISLLVHWNKNPTETEKAAIQLYNVLHNTRGANVNGHNIIFIQMLQEEPVSVDTDEKGVFEYVIECLFYIEKGKEDINE